MPPRLGVWACGLDLRHTRAAASRAQPKPEATASNAGSSCRVLPRIEWLAPPSGPTPAGMPPASPNFRSISNADLRPSARSAAESDDRRGTAWTAVDRPDYGWRMRSRPNNFGGYGAHASRSKAQGRVGRQRSDHRARRVRYGLRQDRRWPGLPGSLYDRLRRLGLAWPARRRPCHLHRDGRPCGPDLPGHGNAGHLRRRHRLRRPAQSSSAPSGATRPPARRRCRSRTRCSRSAAATRSAGA